MNIDEKEKLYRAIHAELIKPFPKGTVKSKKNTKTFIPVQAYINRINQVAGHVTKWTITTTEAIIHPHEQLIEMRGRLSILDTEIEGIGFADFDWLSGKEGKAISFKNEVIKTALSHAYVDACNKYQIGWIDIDRDWSSNPGTGVPEMKIKSGASDQEYIACLFPNCTNNVDLELLKKLSWKNHQCPDHIPAHVIRKYEEKQRSIVK